MSKVNTIITGVAGIAGLEVTDTLTDTLTETAALTAGAASDAAAAAVEAVSTDPTNPITIVDLVVKLAIGFITLWKLIKKPKPTQVK